MADQADDLGLPIRPARPMVVVGAVPPRVPELSSLGAEPVRRSASPRQRTDQSVGSGDNEVDARTLVIGREMSFSGNVTSCDRLIIEGSIEANLRDCQHMIIADTGIFRGSASTENADVRGRVEGDLVVRKRLLIQAGGDVSGTITYGDIEIEAGGKISGEIRPAKT